MRLKPHFEPYSVSYKFQLGRSVWVYTGIILVKSGRLTSDFTLMWGRSQQGLTSPYVPPRTTRTRCAEDDKRRCASCPCCSRARTRSHYSDSLRYEGHPSQQQFQLCTRSLPRGRPGACMSSQEAAAGTWRSSP